MFIKFIVLANVIVFGYGCLITNCPRGGKRGETAVSLENFARECPACGPNRLGQCFGPHICCGPTIGCFFGTPETYKCRKESLFSRPCVAGYAMCRGNTARCAASGICCSQESCHMDATCRLPDITNNNRKAADFEVNAILSDNEISSDTMQ